MPSLPDSTALREAADLMLAYRDMTYSDRRTWAMLALWLRYAADQRERRLQDPDIPPALALAKTYLNQPAIPLDHKVCKTAMAAAIPWYHGGPPWL